MRSLSGGNVLYLACTAQFGLCCTIIPRFSYFRRIHRDSKWVRIIRVHRTKEQHLSHELYAFLRMVHHVSPAKVHPMYFLIYRSTLWLYFYSAMTVEVRSEPVWSVFFDAIQSKVSSIGHVTVHRWCHHDRMRANLHSPSSLWNRFCLRTRSLLHFSSIISP